MSPSLQLFVRTGRVSALPPRCRPRAREAGFSLLEMMVVLVIAGILVSVVSLAYRDDRQQQLQQESERLAQLFEEASDQAQLGSAALRWASTAGGYEFEWQSERGWLPIRDGLLRPRPWVLDDIRAQVQSGDSSGVASSLLFPVELPAGASRVLLQRPGQRQEIDSDGSGRFYVATH